MDESKKPYIWAKEARKLGIILFYVYKVLQEQKLKYGDKCQNSSHLDDRVKFDWNVPLAGSFWDDENVLFPCWAIVRILHVCPNSSKCT